ncbi:hypothetical protein NBF49_004798 [Salmonella enterica]|nr:hypothetical protein [Salmonella enterica]
MQYALFDGQKRKFLLDATEFGVLKDWKDKSDDCIIHKIATKSDFAVSAFLRVQEWDIATNILNREGIFAFKGVEMRFNEPVSEENWKRLISEDRALRCANNLIRCKG